MRLSSLVSTTPPISHWSPIAYHFQRARPLFTSTRSFSHGISGQRHFSPRIVLFTDLHCRVVINTSAVHFINVAFPRPRATDSTPPSHTPSSHAAPIPREQTSTWFRRRIPGPSDHRDASPDSLQVTRQALSRSPTPQTTNNSHRQIPPFLRRLVPTPIPTTSATLYIASYIRTWSRKK